MLAKDKFARSLREALRPPERLKYSEWIEKHFRLPAETSAVSGRFKLWKFQRGIADAVGDPLIERVTVRKATRIGYTKLLLACICADMVSDPGPAILLMPTDDDASGIAVDEVSPAFEACKPVAALLPTNRFDKRNTLTQRYLLGGGSLKILAARAPRNLRRHTARRFYADEVDGMEVTKEGDPIKLGEKRTESYADRKLVRGSTPALDVTSIISKSYEESDKRIFKIACPHCDHRFELLWEHIKYERSRPEEATAFCPECGSGIDERLKPQLVEAGGWEITAPHVAGHAGFQINALVSLQPQATWPKLAQEYEQARKIGPSALQVFHNTVLGLPWSETLIDMTEGEARKRVEDFGLSFDATIGEWQVKLPPEVVYITAGVDVQISRLEVGLVGWSENGHRWFLGQVVLGGSTLLTTTWDRLDALLQSKLPHPLGGEIGIDAAGIDSGDGNRTQQVYNFVSNKAERKIIAIKGRAGPHPVLKRSAQKRKSRHAQRAGVTPYLVGVDQVKADLLSAFGLEKDKAKALRFSNTLDEDWFIQFTSERRKVTYRQGRPVVTFERIGGRAAEALDCAVYGIAVAELVKFNFADRAAELTPPKRDEQTLKARLEKLKQIGRR